MTRFRELVIDLALLALLDRLRRHFVRRIRVGDAQMTRFSTSSGICRRPHPAVLLTFSGGHLAAVRSIPRAAAFSISEWVTHV